jgi:GTP-binding protein
MDFRYKRKYAAENGADGAGGGKSGKDGASLTIRVPEGTIVRDAETGAIIKDLTGCGEFVVAKGGSGGWGNRRFATRQGRRRVRKKRPSRGGSGY